MKFNEAPVFYWLYTLLIVAGGALVLLIPEPAATGQDRSVVAGAERRRASLCADFHAAAHQQEGTDGRIREHADCSTWWRGYHHSCDNIIFGRGRR
jgi:hypothetical protein